MEKKSSSKSDKNAFIQYLLPLVIIISGVLLAMFLSSLKKEPEKQEAKKVFPIVETICVQCETITLKVRSQGTIRPRTATTLIPEVSGLVESISQNFYPGQFFKKGDILLKVDPIEYEVAVANAESQVATAELALSQVQAEAKQAEEDWKEMGEGNAIELVLKRPQLKQAKSNLKAAQAYLKLAKNNLDKTKLKAPYDGYVQTKTVNIGQMLSARMTSLGDIFAIDLAEIRLPVSSRDIAFLELPEVNNDGKEKHPSVLLSTEIAGEKYSRRAEIVRIESSIDPTTRQLFLVAQIDDPYNVKQQAHIEKLRMGQFVEAVINGRVYENAFRLPRSILHDHNKVYVINAENRLEIRTVKVVQLGLNEVIISKGLSSGERICRTPLEFVIDGMQVEIETAEQK